MSSRIPAEGCRAGRAATGIPESRYPEGFDTVSVCFSKGLGALMGSCLAGGAAMIQRARRFRHLFGGGFRQAGFMAAGALPALENHRQRRHGVSHRRLAAVRPLRDLASSFPFSNPRAERDGALAVRALTAGGCSASRRGIGRGDAAAGATRARQIADARAVGRAGARARRAEAPGTRRAAPAAAAGWQSPGPDRAPRPDLFGSGEINQLGVLLGSCSSLAWWGAVRYFHLGSGRVQPRSRRRIRDRFEQE